MSLNGEMLRLSRNKEGGDESSCFQWPTRVAFSGKPSRHTHAREFVPKAIGYDVDRMLASGKSLNVYEGFKKAMYDTSIDEHEGMVSFGALFFKCASGEKYLW